MNNSDHNDLVEQDRRASWAEFWQQWWNYSNIPLLHRGVIQDHPPFSPLDPRNGSLVEVINRLKKRKGSLYLWGTVGSGKTLLASSALYAAASEHAKELSCWFPCPKSPAYRFVSTTHLIQSIKNSFGREGNAGALLDQHAYCKLLVLDDIGAESEKDWVRDVLFQIVDIRYCNMLPTIFTSNLPIAELEARLSDRIADRIVEMCRGGVVKISVPSYRLQEVKREERP